MKFKLSPPPMSVLSANGDKSLSESSIIPPAMLNSRCSVRLSFRLAPVTVNTYKNPKLMLDSRLSLWRTGLHYDHIAHQPESSLELDTRRLLNSAGECCVVHRLIWSSSDGKLVEFSGHCPHDDTSHACDCRKDPSFRAAFLNSQSEVLETYCEERLEMGKEVQRIVDEINKKTAETERKLAASERRLAELERKLAESERSKPCKVFKG